MRGLVWDIKEDLVEYEHQCQDENNDITTITTTNRQNRNQKITKRVIVVASG